MISKDVTYTNFNNEQKTEKLWFHISKTTVLMAESDVYDKIMTLGKGLLDQATSIEAAEKAGEIKSEDPFDKNSIIVANAVRTMAQLLSGIVDLAYGIRSEDGDRFVKSPEVLANFKSSLAYETLFTDLLDNPSDMLLFIESLMKP